MFIPELRAQGLLQQPVGDERFSWTTVCQESVEALAGSHNLACFFADRLTHGEMEQLCTRNGEMGDPHRALLLAITLWSHLWVGHLVEYTATLGGLGRFGVVRAGREAQRSQVGNPIEIFQRVAAKRVVGGAEKTFAEVICGGYPQ